MVTKPLPDTFGSEECVSRGLAKVDDDATRLEHSKNGGSSGRLCRAAPPDPAGLFSEGGEVIHLHIEGSLTIPKPRVRRITMGILRIALSRQALEPLGVGRTGLQSSTVLGAPCLGGSHHSTHLW